MKNKKIILSLLIILILVVVGLITNYVDSARVRNNIEPKYTIKIISSDGNKITYWGLGYKVIRYPAVSPKENFKSSLGVKFGSWFMNYKLSNYDSINIENLTDGTTTKVTKIRDIEFIISLIRDSKYFNGLCNGIRTHKIIIDDEEYQLIEGCSELQHGSKQAKISKEDLDKFLKIINDHNVTDEAKNIDGQYQFVGTIIEASDNYIIVEPEEGSNERKSADKISIGLLENNDSLYTLGTNVKITYNGMIMESYPAQISATNIELVN